MGTFQSEIGVLTPTMRGPTVSLLLLAGAPASLFAGVLADKFGHLSITFVGAVIFTIGAALESAAVNLAILLVGRSLVDVGKGLYLGNMNVYICEYCSKSPTGYVDGHAATSGDSWCMRWVFYLLRYDSYSEPMAMATTIYRTGRGRCNPGFGMLITASLTSLATSQRQAADCNAQPEEARPYGR